jgi:Cu+-exporting ATPase
MTSDLITDKEFELAIEGMTCTACAGRVERQLNKVSGVKSYVDFATETAHLSLTKPVALEEIFQVVSKAGYSATTNPTHLVGASKLNKKLFVSVVLSFLVASLSMIAALQFDYWQWVTLILSIPVVFWGSAPFHQAAYKNLKHKTTTMDTLVSLGVLVSFSWSAYQVLFGGAGAASYRMMFSWLSHSGMVELYFEVATVVPTVVLIGRWLELRTRRSATDSVKALLATVPENSIIKVAGVETEVKTASIKQSDLVVVRLGERIPVDGVIRSGTSSIDASVITGESIPQEVEIGSLVSAGSVNLSGILIISATTPGNASRISLIASLVREATSSKAKIANLTDSISRIFVPFIILLALFTYLAWFFIGDDPNQALTAAVAVLVIACPCALGIAVPISLIMAASVGAKAGAVIRNPDTLSLLSKIDTVVLDKTGTLTSNQMSVTDVVAIGVNDPSEVLARAAAVEKGSLHPIAQAIAKADNQLTASKIREEVSVGVFGEINGLEVFVVNPDKSPIQLSAELQSGVTNLRKSGVVVIVGWGGYVTGLIVVADTVRPTSAVAVAKLHKLGIKTLLLSGDFAQSVEIIAKSTGVQASKSGVSPEQKYAEIVELKKSGVVAMVGDGLNDTAALAQADVGISMGTGTHAAQSAAAITIIGDDPELIPYAIRLGRRTKRTIEQNLFWAFIYNIVLIPVAALGLLNPLLAGTAMAFSSITVVLNSLRMRRFS